MSQLFPAVVPVAPLSTTAIEQIAARELRRLAPGILGTATPVNLSHLVDYVLPEDGIHVSPVDDSELGMWAIAQDHGERGDPIEVLVLESEWDKLHAGGRRAHHARGTIAHEIGHAVMHIDQRRRWRELGGLPRARSVETYRDPEWQAWCFAGCFLAPRASIIAARTNSLTELAEIFQTSVELMTHHCRRLKISVY